MTTLFAEMFVGFNELIPLLVFAGLVAGVFAQGRAAIEFYTETVTVYVDA